MPKHYIRNGCHGAMAAAAVAPASLATGKPTTHKAATQPQLLRRPSATPRPRPGLRRCGAESSGSSGRRRTARSRAVASRSWQRLHDAMSMMSPRLSWWYGCFSDITLRNENRRPEGGSLRSFPHMWKVVLGSPVGNAAKHRHPSRQSRRTQKGPGRTVFISLRWPKHHEKAASLRTGRRVMCLCVWAPGPGTTVIGRHRAAEVSLSDYR